MQNNYIKKLQEFFHKSEVYIDYPIGAKSFMKSGGNADVLFRPRSMESLTRFLESFVRDEGINDITVLGSMSNVVIRDLGVRGVVIDIRKLHKEKFSVENETKFICSAGSLNFHACIEAEKLGLSGLEFLIGIPGTIGGAVFMNAGANGSEVCDRLEWFESINFYGKMKRVSKENFNMRYRCGGIEEKTILIRACFNLKPNLPFNIEEEHKRLLDQRKGKIKIKHNVGTVGSTFKNPTCCNKLAWQLIDEAGCRGMSLGGAMISKEHTNYLVNVNQATTADIEALAGKVKNLVFENSGIALDFEIVFIGEKYGKATEK